MTQAPSIQFVSMIYNHVKYLKIIEPMAMKTPSFAYLCICKLFDHFGNGLIRTRNPENLGVDTIFILLSRILSELGPKNGISVMAAIICILLKMLKDARVASSGFLISTLERYKNCKKTL